MCRLLINDTIYNTEMIVERINVLQTCLRMLLPYALLGALSNVAPYGQPPPSATEGATIDPAAQFPLTVNNRPRH